jgi:hypothetical protein
MNDNSDDDTAETIAGTHGKSDGTNSSDNQWTCSADKQISSATDSKHNAITSTTSNDELNGHVDNEQRCFNSTNYPKSPHADKPARDATPIPVEVTDVPNLFYLSAYPSDGARGA